MAENSKIEWTDATFNPWIGCTKVSPACDHCYAETLSKARLGVPWGAGQPRRRTTAENWKQPLRWNRKAEKEGRRYRVFCASLADVFDAEVPNEWRLDLFRLIVQTPNLDWLLLTKRPKVARTFLSGFAMAPGKSGFLTHNGDTPKGWGGSGEIIHGVSRDQAWPLPNVWLGTTVENQAMAEVRIPLLLETPAAVRFLSMEPLLGPVDLTDIDYNPFLDGLRKTPRPCPDDPDWPQLRYDALRGHLKGPDDIGLPRLDWVIAGGESGAKARPMHPEWARSLRDQCAAAGVPFFFKQWGEWATSAISMSTGAPVFRRFETFDQWVSKASTWINGGICLDRDGTLLHIGADFMDARDSGKFPVTIMHRVGKARAGHLLDGVEHRAVPGVGVRHG